eukprot:gene18539-25046_t
MLMEGPGFFHENVSFTLHTSKQNRADQPLSLMLDAVSSMLLGASSPFQIRTTTQSVVLETKACDLVAWMHTNQFDKLVFLAEVAQVKKQSLDIMFTEDLAMAARCSDSFSVVNRIENGLVMNVAHYSPIVLQQRAQVVGLAVNYGLAFGLEETTTHDGLQLFDKLMCRSTSLPGFGVSLWPQCLCSCLLLAASQCGQQVPVYEQIQMLTGFDADSLSSMEASVIEWLDHDLLSISVLRVIHIYLERLGLYLHEFKALNSISDEVSPLLLKAACKPHMLSVRPSALAAAVLIVLRRRQGQVPHWPMSLQLMTGYTNVENGDMSACIALVQSLLDESPQSES